MNRLLLTAILGVIAAVMVTIAFVLDKTATPTDLLLNLGSEVVGIALTVAIVDWLIERAKLREEALRIGWAMLHDIDHAVWVWQGGRREFHLDELMALLNLVEDSDPLPPLTQNLLANLGIRASDSLRLQARVFRLHRDLKHAMQLLASLSQIRELNTLMPPSFVVDALRSAITKLAGVTGQGLHPNEFGIAKTYRDSSLAAQEARYRGIEQDQFMGGSRWPVAGVARQPESHEARAPIQSGDGRDREPGPDGQR